MGGRLKLAVCGVPLALGGRGQLQADVWLGATEAGHVVITHRSRMVLNPLSDLRTQLVEPVGLALDGNDNLGREYGPVWQHLRGLQLANVAVVICVLLARVARAARVAPALLRGRVWVQQCEVCRDHAVAGAAALVRELADRPISDAEMAEARTVARRERNLLCVAWRGRAASSPERKVYAKREDLRRAEITLHNRKAVMALLDRAGGPGERSADLGGPAAARLLADVAVAATPLLDGVAGVVAERAAVPPRTGAALLLGLAPLIRLAAPAPRPPGAGGRRPAAALPARARRAIEILVADGAYDARGLGDSDAVLAALREMAAAGALDAPPRGAPVHRGPRPEWRAPGAVGRAPAGRQRAWGPRRDRPGRLTGPAAAPGGRNLRCKAP
jgi:hypothetical protein